MNQLKLSILFLAFLVAPAQGASFLKQALPHAASLSAFYMPLMAKYSITYFLGYSTDKMINDRIRQECNEIKVFVDEELNRCNRLIPNLQVKPDLLERGYASAMKNKTLGVTSTFRKDLFRSGLIKKPSNIVQRKDSFTYYPEPISDENEREKLANQLKMVIHHETNHIRNGDKLKRRIFEMTTPVALYISTLPLVRTIQNGIKHSLAKGAFKVSSLIPLYFANEILNSAYCKHQERLADQVPDDINILKSGIAFFEKGAGSLDNEDNSFVAKVKCMLFDEHPTNQERVDYFKKRIAQLEAK